MKSLNEYDDRYDMASMYGAEDLSDRNSDEEAEWSRRSTNVTVCDINQAMLDVGKSRATKRGYKQGTDHITHSAINVNGYWFIYSF